MRKTPVINLSEGMEQMTLLFTCSVPVSTIHGHTAETLLSKARVWKNKCIAMVTHSKSFARALRWRREALVSHESSAQALPWLILHEDSWLQPPFRLDLGTAHHLHTQGGLSISQGMDEDAPERVCKRCWKEVGARAPTVRMVDGIMALIYRYSPSLLPVPCSSELRPPLVSCRNFPAELWRCSYPKRNVASFHTTSLLGDRRVPPPERDAIPGENLPPSPLSNPCSMSLRKRDVQCSCHIPGRHKSVMGTFASSDILQSGAALLQMCE
ncbi:hypothetical protein EK904_003925 [Melospiza melodia maxima]|nr:hypothetical protein EK904_003925 [Melospiza melodia maxima]